MKVLDKFRLDNKVVIITGGAGLLGSEYSKAIAEAGGVSVIADINTEGAREVAKKLQGETGGQALAVTVDVGNKTSVKAMVRIVLKKFGRIDGLVNNAALDPKFDKKHADKHTNSFEDFPLPLWKKSLEIDLTGRFLCSQAAAVAMLSGSGGSIVNIASTYSLVGPDQRLYEKDKTKAPKTYKPVSYVVSNSAILGLTRYLATYWAGKNIRVNTLIPHGVYNNHDDDFVKRYNFRTPIGRMAQKDEFNGALLFLLSSASSYMTGSTLVMDGGWTAW